MVHEFTKDETKYFLKFGHHYIGNAYGLKNWNISGFKWKNGPPVIPPEKAGYHSSQSRQQGIDRFGNPSSGRSNDSSRKPIFDFDKQADTRQFANGPPCTIRHGHNGSMYVNDLEPPAYFVRQHSFDSDASWYKAKLESSSSMDRSTSSSRHEANGSFLGNRPGPGPSRDNLRLGLGSPDASRGSLFGSNNSSWSGSSTQSGFCTSTPIQERRGTPAFGCGSRSSSDISSIGSTGGMFDVGAAVSSSNVSILTVGQISSDRSSSNASLFNDGNSFAGSGWGGQRHNNFGGNYRDDHNRSSYF